MSDVRLAVELSDEDVEEMSREWEEATGLKRYKNKADAKLVQELIDELKRDIAKRIRAILEEERDE
jgi:hypothetical protein